MEIQPHFSASVRSPWTRATPDPNPADTIDLTHVAPPPEATASWRTFGIGVAAGVLVLAGGLATWNAWHPPQPGTSQSTEAAQPVKDADQSAASPGQSDSCHPTSPAKTDYPFKDADQVPPSRPASPGQTDYPFKDADQILPPRPPSKPTPPAPRQPDYPFKDADQFPPQPASPGYPVEDSEQ